MGIFQQPNQFYSCLIRYGENEQPFVERLYGDLHARGLRCWTSKGDSKAGLKNTPTLDLPHPLNALLAIQSAVAGLGAVLMDKHLCEPERESGILKELSKVEIPFGGYYLAVNARAGRRKAVRAVRQWLFDECQSYR